MSKRFLLFVLFIVTIKETISRILSLDFNCTLDLFYIKFFFGVPLQEISLSVNTAMPFTHVGDKYFIKEKSPNGKLIETVDKVIGTKTYNNVIHFEDNLIIDQMIVGDDFHFYIFDSFKQSWSYGFGLAYQYENESFSFIDLLYKKKRIEKRIFALVLSQIK